MTRSSVETVFFCVKGIAWPYTYSPLGRHFFLFKDAAKFLVLVAVRCSLSRQPASPCVQWLVAKLPRENKETI